MSKNDSVIAALEVALQASPEDIGLLAHLAQLLCEDERDEDALPLYQQMLVQEPANVTALRGARQCAEKLGNSAMSAAYNQLLVSLGQESVETNSHVVSANQQTKSSAVVPNLRVVGGTEVDHLAEESSEPEITLADVGGMESVKRRLHLSFLGPLSNPELMATYGKDVGGGLLLYGPPGCGKTFIARALAGELRANFLSIGLSDVLDMYIGESERRLHELFEEARRKRPAILFFDELDALGQKRSQLRNSGMRSVVNQLLSEMDSINTDNKNLFIIGATNHPWDVDAALKRPGRFDRTVAVFPPDQQARSYILQSLLAKRPTEDIDIAQLAGRTKGFSGADLKHLVESAVEYVLESCIESGNVRPLVNRDFDKPLKDLRPSTYSWFETARNYAMFANESGAYDELLEYIRAHKL
ncbi:MAG: ATP-binding protein [Chromatiales bacterium]|nr:ATP-binding protein [Chromatiales bacterium]